MFRLSCRGSGHARHHHKGPRKHSAPVAKNSVPSSSTSSEGDCLPQWMSRKDSEPLCARRTSHQKHLQKLEKWVSSTPITLYQYSRGASGTGRRKNDRGKSRLRGTNYQAKAWVPGCEGIVEGPFHAFTMGDRSFQGHHNDCGYRIPRNTR